MSTFLTSRVCFVCVPPIVELDLFGPLEVFRCGSMVQHAHARTAEPRYDIQVISGGQDRVVVGECGLPLQVHAHYSEVMLPIDTLILVSGQASVTAEIDAEFARWLCDASSRTRRTASICVGAFALGAAGLLDGRRVATHWEYAAQLSARFPRILVDPEPIWIRDGSLYTSAGVTAGIDLALALVEEDLGTRTALEIARRLVVFLKRPGGQRQFSAPLAGQLPSRSSFSDLAAWIVDHLQASLSVDLLADRMAMSPRNFTRVFKEQTGSTPATFVRRVRVESARSLLEQTPKSAQEVAHICGFMSHEVMRRAFIDELGVSPSQYRATFAPSAE